MAIEAEEAALHQPHRLEPSGHSQHLLLLLSHPALTLSSSFYPPPLASSSFLFGFSLFPSICIVTCDSLRSVACSRPRTTLLAWGSLRLFPEPRKLTRPPATSIPSILPHPLAVFCVLIRPSFSVLGLHFDASFPLLAPVTTIREIQHPLRGLLRSLGGSRFGDRLTSTK